VRALDPRLLRRTRSARPLLTVDVLLGIGTALAVLVQASLLALIVARAFDGVALEALWLDIGLLVAAFVARGACVWGMEIAGRRAARPVRAPPGDDRAAAALAAERGRRRPRG
jgi:hypothetical protein